MAKEFCKKRTRKEDAKRQEDEGPGFTDLISAKEQLEVPMSSSSRAPHCWDISHSTHILRSSSSVHGSGLDFPELVKNNG